MSHDTDQQILETLREIHDNISVYVLSERRISHEISSHVAPVTS